MVALSPPDGLRTSGDLNTRSMLLSQKGEAFSAANEEGRPVNKRVIFLTAAIAAALVTVSAQGQGYRWLDTSPIKFFSDEDWELMRSTARKTLDNSRDGTTANWSNPETDASGSITVISTYEEDGRRCRKTKFYNSARGLTGSGIFRLCRIEDGTWKIAP